MKILIVEDDKKIRQELKILLESNGYYVEVIDDFSGDIVEDVKHICKNLILLDVNLPNENGFDICKKIKEQELVPVIFVTSCTKEEDELKSILVGGDDFITKPYNKDILLEKIKRTIALRNPLSYKEIKVKDVTLDLHLSTVFYHNNTVELTRNEFRILYYFFTNPEKIITKEELLDYLWNEKYYLDDNILTVNINRLSKKLEEVGLVDFITTVRKKGYRLG